MNLRELEYKVFELGEMIIEAYDKNHTAEQVTRKMLDVESKIFELIDKIIERRLKCLEEEGIVKRIKNPEEVMLEEVARLAGVEDREESEDMVPQEEE